eukprot:3451205-Heterocapsa_arctica.AAC.1
MTQQGHPGGSQGQQAPLNPEASDQPRPGSIYQELLELEAARRHRERLVIAIVDDNDGPPEQPEQEETEWTHGLVQILDITRCHDRAPQEEDHPSAGELYRELTRRALRARARREGIIDLVDELDETFDRRNQG